MLSVALRPTWDAEKQALKDRFKNQTVYALLYTFNNNEKEQTEGRHKDGKIKHCEKIHVTYWKRKKKKSHLDKWAFTSMWHKKKYRHAIRTRSVNPCTKRKSPPRVDLNTVQGVWVSSWGELEPAPAPILVWTFLSFTTTRRRRTEQKSEPPGVTAAARVNWMGEVEVLLNEHLMWLLCSNNMYQTR